MDVRSGKPECPASVLTELSSGEQSRTAGHDEHHVIYLYDRKHYEHINPHDARTPVQHASDLTSRNDIHIRSGDHRHISSTRCGCFEVTRHKHSAVIGLDQIWVCRHERAIFSQDRQRLCGAGYPAGIVGVRLALLTWRCGGRLHSRSLGFRRKATTTR